MALPLISTPEGFLQGGNHNEQSADNFEINNYNKYLSVHTTFYLKFGAEIVI